MPTYMARSHWHGSFEDGQGSLSVGSAAFETAVAPKTKEVEITNPEEVVGAALASCYTLMLSKKLGDAGHPPNTIRSSAGVNLKHEDDGPRIVDISLDVEVDVEGVGGEELKRIADEADQACPVSQALKGTQVRINAYPSKNT